ncbi:MAG: TldD/PmbA family protein, partial [Chloroflexi bacterium]|nr:TldD/PmbA family protein [Chloroflexota bacterium]
MLGEKRFKEIADHILTRSSAEQTEVLILGEDRQLTRFANSYIHQNVSENNAELRVRAVLGQRAGVSSTNDLSTAGTEKVLEEAIAVARLQPPNPDFRSLPSPTPIPKVNGFVERTVQTTPQARAKAVGAICRLAKDKGLVASGAFTTAVFEMGVANSRGVFAYDPSTLADMKTVILGDSGSGYAQATSMDVAQIEAEILGKEAVDKAIRSQNPKKIEPGEYTVILEEYAVQEMLFYLSYMSFSALAVQEKRSFMAERLGQKVMSENVYLWDDGVDPRGLPAPFDYEGVAKKKVEFISSGTAKEVVYDSYTAGREEGKNSSGHALPAPNPEGPLPWNIIMGNGGVTKEELLAKIEKGIWVSRFWYINPIHPLRTVITGMTRDGTFLIQKGEIARPIKNLRFTQSIVEA